MNVPLARPKPKTIARGEFARRRRQLMRIMGRDSIAILADFGAAAWATELRVVRMVRPPWASRPTRSAAVFPNVGSDFITVMT